MDTCSIRSRRFSELLPSIIASAPEYIQASVVKKNPNFKRYGVYMLAGTSSGDGIVVGKEGAGRQTMVCTPSQEIAVLYRSRTSVPPDGGLEMATFDNVMPTPRKEPKALFRQSRYDALVGANREAKTVARVQNVGPDDRVLCQRPGCSDVLANTKALSYHIHIHNLEHLDQIIVCSRCNQHFDTQGAHNTHKCTSRRRRHRFFKRGVRRIIFKIPFFSA